jgi:acetolactate decarboxylase
MRDSWLRACVMSLGVVALAATKAYEVKWVGEMHKVMMMGMDQGIVSLMSLKDLPNLYALGPVEGLNGEITVLNGEPSIATIRDGQPVVEKTFKVEAPLLVYVQVAKWSRTPIPASVRTLDELDKFAASSARKAGLDAKAPFPFRVTARMSEVQMHIDNRQGREAKGREAHEAIEFKIPLKEATVELIGFWSDQHGGVFTHMGQNTHIHGRTTDGKISDHVDSFQIASGDLWLPAIR